MYRERGRRTGRQKKRWEDNTNEWTGLEFANSVPEGCGEQKTMEGAGCKVVSGAPTIFCGFRKNCEDDVGCGPGSIDCLCCSNPDSIATVTATAAIIVIIKICVSKGEINVPMACVCVTLK